MLARRIDGPSGVGGFRRVTCAGDGVEGGVLGGGVWGWLVGRRWVMYLGVGQVGDV